MNNAPKVEMMTRGPVKRILMLWILLAPVLLNAQNDGKDEDPLSKPLIFTIDLDKEKKEEPVKKEKPVKANEQSETFEKKKEKPAKTPDAFSDPRQTGLFKALFIAGVNGCQIDGDRAYGYRYWGAHAGVGVLVQFHRYISFNLEMLYSMKGAKDKARADDPLSTNFSIAWDYIEVPVGFNFNDKKVFMVGLGVAPSVLVRDKETINGVEEYVSPSGSPPKKFDLPVYFNVSFLIKRVFAITGRFSYSTFGLRDSYPGTKVSKQYNNVITLRLMYILSTKKKK